MFIQLKNADNKTYRAINSDHVVEITWTGGGSITVLHLTTGETVEVTDKPNRGAIEGCMDGDAAITYVDLIEFQDEWMGGVMELLAKILKATIGNDPHAS